MRVFHIFLLLMSKFLSHVMLFHEQDRRRQEAVILEFRSVTATEFLATRPLWDLGALCSRLCNFECECFLCLLGSSVYSFHQFLKEDCEVKLRTKSLYYHFLFLLACKESQILYFPPQDSQSYSFLPSFLNYPLLFCSVSFWLYSRSHPFSSSGILGSYFIDSHSLFVFVQFSFLQPLT